MSPPDSAAASAPAAWMRIARSELAAADGPYDPHALPGVYVVESRYQVVAE